MRHSVTHALNGSAQNRSSKMTTITTLANGDVRVQQPFFNGEEMDTFDRTFTVIGAYVYQVNPNGTTSQICEGLQLRGATLMAGNDLAATIHAALK
jgi:hypothetical protein